MFDLIFIRGLKKKKKNVIKLLFFFFFFRLLYFWVFIFIFILTPRLQHFENFLVNQKIKKWWPKYPFINNIWLLIRIVDTSHWKWTENCAIFHQIHFRLLFEVVKFYSKLCSGVLIYVPHIYSFIIYLYYIPCINLVLFFSEIVLISSRVKYFTSDDIIFFHISLVMIWFLQWRHHNVVNIQSNCRNAWFWRRVTWYDAIVNVTWRRVNGWHILTHFLKHIVEKGM